MAEDTVGQLPEIKGKLCIACKEQIPADATICSHCHTSQIPAKPQRLNSVVTWVGAASACIGLFATLLAGVRWMDTHRQQQKETSMQSAIAEDQLQRGEYEAAFNTYQAMLQSNAKDQKAVDGRLNAAELWVENFHVTGNDEQAAAQLAGSKLDEIFPVFDAALVHVTGPQKADVLAHAGWAHWLNQHIAEREFGPAAEKDLRDALALDPSNVYANAMLGNWLLQNGNHLQEAIPHFKAADSAGKALPLVRRMELGGLEDMAGAQQETVRIVNEMRKNGEPLSDAAKRRLFTGCYVTVLDTREELVGVLAALPAPDALATFQWLASTPSQSEGEDTERSFIEANLLELAGRKTEALQEFRAIHEKQKRNPTSFYDQVDAALKRLS
jgi:tetratricopeptide (TPR) repeat protein